MAALIALGVVVVVLLLLYLIAAYNGLVSKRINVQNGWSQIDVVLKRRHDLIPNLVETVKGYAAHERQTLENVTKARQQAVSAQGVAQQTAAENMLTSALRQLFAVAEAYPDLKANTNFLQLQGELANTENQIASGRQDYNNTVTQYNTAVQQFPSNIVAGLFAFQKAEFYTVEDPAHRQVPQVKF